MSYIKHRSDESLEDYLETILSLQNKHGQVRSIDIANELNFTKQEKDILERIDKIVKYGIIDTTTLYQYGLYPCTVAGELNPIPAPISLTEGGYP